MLAVIGKKIGMTQMFDESGNVTPVTVIQVDENVVLGERKKQAHGYDAVIVGALAAKKNRVSKPVLGQFPKGSDPLKIIREFRDFDHECKVGDKISVEIFKDTSFVDIIGVSKGKGFQGVVRRHGFKGGGRTHGSKLHREMGSTGQNTFPAHTFKGKKMPGHMGNVRVTARNLRLVKIDAANKMLIVKGSVPGSINGMIIIRTAKRK